MSTFLISDLHLGHDNSRKFLRFDGKPLRNFDSLTAMHDYMIYANNSVVKPSDRLYILGDVAINKNSLSLLKEFNGHKVLIKGNHDIFKLKDYLPYFDDIRGSHKLENYILTHIPIHAQSVPRWADGNIHGHLHYNWVGTYFATSDPRDLADTRYFNVSCELLNYTPINFERLKFLHKEFCSKPRTISTITEELEYR